MLFREVKHVRQMCRTPTKYEPRTENRESFRVSGPFEQRADAEAAARDALATHTCLSARVISRERDLAMLAAADEQKRRTSTSPTEVYFAVRRALVEDGAIEGAALVS
jgi:hypothetical protein